MSTQAAAPQSFYCPITLEIMKDPFCDKEGNSFEKAAILDWITKHGTSPITRTPMSATDLTPNRALKDSIVEHFNTKVASSTPTATSDQQMVSTPDPEIQLIPFIHDSKMMVTVDPGDSSTRTFLNISCVIDISGSMATEAPVPGEDDRESTGLTILDIVKHAVTTVIKSLGPKDRLSLITFSDSAEVVLPLTEMDQSGQLLAINALRILQPTNSTNLWAGLEKGLDVLNTAHTQDDGRLSTVMLFTDGEPNVVPPRGHIPMLQMYKDQRGGILPGIIHTFGFGYSLDSQLLNDLAFEGQGRYYFIPDSGMVGTIFVHAIANLKVTVAKNCRLTIEPLSGSKFVDPSKDLGQLLVSQEGWGITIDLGSLQTGQVKDIVLEMKDLPAEGAGVPFATVNLSTRTRTGTGDFKVSNQFDRYRKSNTQIWPAYYRLKFIQVVRAGIELCKNGPYANAQSLINDFIQEIEGNPLCDRGLVQPLLEDLKGQVLESFQEGHFDKWGRHYLPSLIFAHLHQVCNNFKDPGPMIYGGALFKTLRDEADALFCSLPPPKPSGQKRGSRPMPTNMSAYHNSRGVCFHGNCSVHMADGTTKKVQDVVKGDCVKTLQGGSATILCKVETKMAEEDEVELVECLGGLLVTPWHPIRLGEVSDWVFPVTLADAESKLIRCAAVYNFVLDEGHVMIINSVECVTLGHSFEGPVCGHEYFGSQKVIQDLKSMSGFKSGWVKIEDVERDPNTDRIVALIEE